MLDFIIKSGKEKKKREKKKERNKEYKFEEKQNHSSITQITCLDDFQGFRIVYSQSL